MLRAADVRFGYGQTGEVLHGVRFEVAAGAFSGILGPNGSGKTTLLRLLAGTERPTRGRVLLDERDVAMIPRRALARRMAVVPQETTIAFEYSVLEVVMMGRYPHLGAFEIEGPADFAVAREALASTGTLPLEGRRFSTLSGGEKQRVIIAAALAQIGTTPGGILLLDEPTAALDLGHQLDTAGLLRELQARLGLTVVVSTHDLNFAASLCRSLLLLRDGRVLAAGDTRDVLTPAHISALYDVEADIQDHPRAGHLVVVPVGRATG